MLACSIASWSAYTQNEHQHLCYLEILSFFLSCNSFLRVFCSNCMRTYARAHAPLLRVVIINFTQVHSTTNIHPHFLLPFMLEKTINNWHWVLTTGNKLSLSAHVSCACLTFVPFFRQFKLLPFSTNFALNFRHQHTNKPVFLQSTCDRWNSKNKLSYQSHDATGRKLKFWWIKLWNLWNARKW